MKIAIFLRYLGGGGAERVMLNLALGFLQQGYAVDLVLCKAWGPHLWKVPSGVSIIDLDTKYTFSSILCLSSYLKSNHPLALISALHFTNEIAILAKLISNSSTKLIISEHNTLSRSIQQSAKFRKFLILFCVKFLYRFADGIVSVSKASAFDLCKITKLAQSKIRCIYNPVLTPDLLLKSKEKITHSWFQSQEIPVILGVGKLEPQKDFFTLIHAFARVRKIIPCRLAILGWGPEQTQLEKLISDLGVSQDAKLFGYVDNPFPYMSLSKVFVLSSAWEGLPTVLIEAMALGVPVIATDCPGGTAEILKGGKYGTLIAVGDVEALSEAIIDLLAGNKKQVDLDWLDQFTVTTSVKQYQDLILALPAEKSI